MTPEQIKLKEMLLTRPLNEIPKSGSIAYFAFWNGYKGNTAYKYIPGSTTDIAFKAGIERRKKGGDDLEN